MLEQLQSLSRSVSLGSQPRRAAQTLLVSLGVLVAFTLPLFFGRGAPDVGADVARHGDAWVVDWVDGNGIAQRAGLRVGDVITALEGKTQLTRRTTDSFLDFGLAGSWTVLRQGESLTLRPDFESVSADTLVDTIVFVSIALVFWGMATLVRLRKPDDGLANRFYWLNVSIGTVFALATATTSNLPAKIVEVVGFAAVPAFFVSFFVWLTMGSTRGAFARMLEMLFYVAGAFFGGAFLLASINGESWYELARDSLRGFLAAGFLSGLMVLTWGYLKPGTPNSRQQVYVVLIGTALAVLPFTVFNLVPSVVGMQPLTRPQFLALGAVFLPVTFGYSILRQGLMDIEVVVERTLVYSVMTLLLAGFYGIVLYGLQLTGLGQAQTNPLVALLFFAGVTLTYVPARDQVRRLIDRLIYRDRYNYAQTLQSLGAKLASPRPIDQTLTEVAEGLASAMNLRGAAVLLREPDGGMVVRGASGDCRTDSVAQSLVERTEKWQNELQGGFNQGQWIPLTAHGEESGLLYLGPKRASTSLTVEDVSLAETVASQASVAVANALLVERLQAKVTELEMLRDRLLRVQEDERKRLAQDLHDGPLHTVLDLVRQAEGITGGLPSASLPDMQLVDRICDLAERGRDAAHEVRAVCADLYPSELAHLGLAAALESLARTTSRDEDISVSFSAKGFSFEHRLPRVFEDTLYRVAREALNNACRHADATVASIELCLKDDQLSLTVADDGRGFAVPASTSALLRRGHLGLASMRERIQRLGGDLAITSCPGQGTRVRARVSITPEVVE